MVRLLQKEILEGGRVGMARKPKSKPKRKAPKKKSKKKSKYEKEHTEERKAWLEYQKNIKISRRYTILLVLTNMNQAVNFILI